MLYLPSDDPTFVRAGLKSDLVDRRKVWPVCCKKLFECLLELHKQPVTGVLGECGSTKENTDRCATLKRTSSSINVKVHHSKGVFRSKYNTQKENTDQNATLKSTSLNDADMVWYTLLFLTFSQTSQFPNILEEKAKMLEFLSTDIIIKGVTSFDDLKILKMKTNQ